MVKQLQNLFLWGMFYNTFEFEKTPYLHFLSNDAPDKTTANKIRAAIVY